MALDCVAKDLDEPDDGFIDKKSTVFLSSALNGILLRARSVADVDKVFDALTDRNAQLPVPAFSCEAEEYFRLVYGSTWRALGNVIPENEIMQLFNRIVDVEIPSDYPETDILVTSKAMCLNALIGSMDEYDAREAWKKMGDLRDNFTLTAVIKGMPDFTSAKGFVDEYFESENAVDATVNLGSLNALLDRCETPSDIRECRELYIKHGLLPEGGNLEDIGDEYTQGIMLNSKGKDYGGMLRLLRRHKNDSKPRSVKTLGSIVNKAPDYDTAREMLYGSGFGAVTSEEQEMMRSSAMLLSWLVEKAKKPKEVADVRKIVSDVRRRERSGECLEPMFCHPDMHLLTAVVKSRPLFPSTADALDFFKEIKTEFPEMPENLFPICNIAERMLADDDPDPSEKTLSFLNNLIINNRYAPVNMVRRLVKARFYCRHKVFRNTKFPNLRGTYPMFDADGEFSLREARSIDFALNMLERGLMHPFMLPCLVKFVVDKQADPEQKLKYIFGQALKWKINVDHEAFISIRDTLGERGVKIDLLPLAHNYSIIKELTMRLHNDKQSDMRPISVDEAFGMIKDYERRTGNRIYFSQRFMDAVVKGFTTETDATFDNVIHKISLRLPSHFKYSASSGYFIAHLVRCPANFDRLRELMSNKPFDKMTYEALISAISRSTEENRCLIAEKSLMELERSLAAGVWVESSYIVRILAFTRRFDLQMALDFIETNGVKVRGNNYDIFSLMQLVRTPDDYRKVLEIAGKEMRPEVMAAIPAGLVYAMYDDIRKTVRTDVFGKFNNKTMVSELNYMASFDKKNSLGNAIKKICRNINNRQSSLTRAFIDFWKRVSGFRL